MQVRNILKIKNTLIIYILLEYKHDLWPGETKIVMMLGKMFKVLIEIVMKRLCNSLNMIHVSPLSLSHSFFFCYFRKRKQKKGRRKRVQLQHR